MVFKTSIFKIYLPLTFREERNFINWRIFFYSMLFTLILLGYFANNFSQFGAPEIILDSYKPPVEDEHFYHGVQYHQSLNKTFPMNLKIKTSSSKVANNLCNIYNDNKTDFFFIWAF